MMAAFAAIWRAALRGADFAVHFSGETGQFKTEVAALLQQHWGPELNARHLPGAWSSTANAMEAIAFHAKDALLVVDDFAPAGTQQDVARLHRDADRLLRAQGNQAGRQRMRADTSLRPSKPPRGLICSTGEDVPRGHSLRARLLVIEITPGAIDATILTACQADAAAGSYAATLASFVQWVAGRRTQVDATWAPTFAHLRGAATRSEAHRRTAEIVASLTLGLAWFLRFAEDVGALDSEQIERLWQEAWEALGELALAQPEHHGASEPTQRFFRLLVAALTRGSAHLADPTGGAPGQPEFGGGRCGEGWRASSERIGWTDGENIYLEPDVAYATAQKVAREQGESLPIGLPTLKKRLYEKKLLASTETRDNRLRYAIRRTLEGRRRDVLHVKYAHFFGDAVAQVAQQNSEGREDAIPSWATVRAILAGEVAPAVAQEQSRDSGPLPVVGPPGPPAAEERMAEADSDEDDEWSA
jgi:hypothetical protein